MSQLLNQTKQTLCFVAEPSLGAANVCWCFVLYLLDEDLQLVELETLMRSATDSQSQVWTGEATTLLAACETYSHSQLLLPGCQKGVRGRTQPDPFGRFWLPPHILPMIKTHAQKIINLRAELLPLIITA